MAETVSILSLRLGCLKIILQQNPPESGRKLAGLRTSLLSQKGKLILLSHKHPVTLCRADIVCRQQGHLGIFLARATAIRVRNVGMENGTYLWVRIGSAPGSVTVGKGRFLDPRFGNWSGGKKRSRLRTRNPYAAMHSVAW